MKTRILCAAMALVFLIPLSLTACGSQKTVTEQEKLTVTVGNLVQTVNADGALSLPLDRKLSFGASGTIELLNVEEGDKVTKGMLLARLEIAALQRGVKAADLAISAAQADQKQAELAVKTAEADSKHLQDNVKSAAIDVELAADNYRKISYPYTYRTFAVDVPMAIASLYSAEQQLDRAIAGLKTPPGSPEYGDAEHQLILAKDNLTQARQRISLGQGPELFGEYAGYTASATPPLAAADFWTLRAAQLQLDKAQMAAQNAKTLFGKSQVAIDNARVAAGKSALAVDKARFDLDTAKEMVDKAVINAPFDGIIAKLDVRVGDSFSAVDFTRTIMEIVDPRRMELTVDVDEIDIPSVKMGQEATITIDALPGEKLTGKVVFISPLSKVESGVVLYEVKIAIDVPESLGLKSGMSSTANIAVARRENVLILPTRAIAQDSSGKTTVKLLVNNQIEERTVVTGISDNFNTEIVSGLNEGDTVVIERQVQTGSGGVFG